MDFDSIPMIFSSFLIHFKGEIMDFDSISKEYSFF
jgi:hypothetical protein